MQHCSLPHQTFSPPDSFTAGCCLLRWLSLFIPSRAISLLFSSSILGTYRPGEFIFQCQIFLPFHTVHGVLKARILKNKKPFPSPVDYVLSELSTMIRLSWMALYSMAHSFIELRQSRYIGIQSQTGLGKHHYEQS